MLKDLFSNRLFLGAFAFFVLIVVSGTLYLQYVERQTAEKLAETQDSVAQWNERQNPTTEVKAGDTSQGGDFHADGTWHKDPHIETRAPTEIVESASTTGTDITVAGIGQETSESEFMKKYGVSPPPRGYAWALMADGTYQLRERNTPHVNVAYKKKPRFNSYWLPDRAYRYYKALRVIIYNNGGGVVEVTTTDQARAAEMLTTFKGSWAPQTSIALSIQGIYDGEVSAAEIKAKNARVAEKVERSIEQELGIDRINGNRNTIDYDLVREILADIRGK